MKVLASAVVVATAVQSAHIGCDVAMDVTSTNSSAFSATDNTNDATFAGLCGLSYFHDQFFKWTATCNGLGLITLRGNSNVTRMTATVATGTCAAPTLVPVQTDSQSYTFAPEDAECVSDFQRGIPDDDSLQQRIQFEATLDTEYILSVGSNINASTGEIGNWAYDVTFDCAPPASFDSAAPIVVEAGNSYTYHNVGSSSDTSLGCVGGGASNAFFQFVAPCDGEIEFALVSAEDSQDAFHGEDLVLGIYANNASEDSLLLCVDNPILLANGTNGTGTGLIPGGLTKGASYIIVVAVWSNSNNEAPFVLQLSDIVCPTAEEPESGAALAGISMATILAIAFL